MYGVMLPVLTANVREVSDIIRMLQDAHKEGLRMPQLCGFLLEAYAENAEYDLCFVALDNLADLGLQLGMLSVLSIQVRCHISTMNPHYSPLKFQPFGFKRTPPRHRSLQRPSPGVHQQQPPRLPPARAQRDEKRQNRGAGRDYVHAPGRCVAEGEVSS